ncbi:MAG: amino acid-binding protein [Desulfobacteraceae bacterium]|nr:amino acid-binding protein [Desulfobacteraceae bacterium]
MKMKEISIPIQNSRSVVYEVVHALEEKNIDIQAINIVDTGNCGQLRLLSSDVMNIRRILMQHHIPARVENVAAVELNEDAGSLAEIMKALMQADIQVKYAYRCNAHDRHTDLMVLACSDADKAIQVLHGSKRQHRAA